MKNIVSFVVAALLVGTPAHAQDKTNEIDKIFSWVTPSMPGCAVAASHHGKVVVNRAYGLADLERDVPITPGTVFDAASIRKQFVAASVLLLVEEGRLALSDDVRNFIPELSDYGHKITVDHLLTHTSGLRDWPGLLNLAGGDPDAMTMILRQRGLNFAPGEEWSYSNSGYVLATEIVARTSGMSFAEFTRKRLFEPLGMKTTTYVDDMRDVIKDRALAYEKAGNRWKQDILLGNDRDGGGALFSDESDDLKSVFEMKPGANGLMIGSNDSPGEGFEFRPVDRDTFQRGMITFRFRRDEAGKIVGLHFNNPVLRNIEFTRLSDPPAGR